MQRFNVASIFNGTAMRSLAITRTNLSIYNVVAMRSLVLRLRQGCV